jgi:hypothetical protein
MNDKFKLCDSGIAGYGVRLDDVAGLWAVVDYFPDSGRLEIVPLNKDQEKALFSGSDEYRYIHESEFWLLMDGTINLLN